MSAADEKPEVDETAETPAPEEAAAEAKAEAPEAKADEAKTEEAPEAKAEESAEAKPKKAAAKKAKADDAEAEGEEKPKAKKAAAKPKAAKPKADEAEKPAKAEKAEAAAAAKPKRAAKSETGEPVVVRAYARSVRTSARKARLVCDHIRGKSVEEARAILAFTPRAVARDWSKLLESAVANAENNHELVGDELRIKAVYADEGATLKRFQPRAQGRATRIRKRTSHLTILLTPKE